MGFLRLCAVVMTGGLALLVPSGKKHSKRGRPRPKQTPSTCSAGVEPPAKARSYFAQERRNAKKAGSRGYIWRAAQDGDVCERCAANAGRRFSWDKEPAGGHAGAKARCRCYPEAIF